MNPVPMTILNPSPQPPPQKKKEKWSGSGIKLTAVIKVQINFLLSRLFKKVSITDPYVSDGFLGSMDHVDALRPL